MAMRLNRMIKGEGAYNERSKSEIFIETFKMDLAACEKKLKEVMAMTGVPDEEAVPAANIDDPRS